MSLFPLYDRLVAEMQIHPPAKMDLKDISQIISDFSHEDAEIVYLLIWHYANQQIGGVPYRTSIYKEKPFKGSRGCMFEMKDLPPEVGQIIAKYVELRIAGMEI